MGCRSVTGMTGPSEPEMRRLRRYDAPKRHTAGVGAALLNSLSQSAREASSTLAFLERFQRDSS